MNIYTTFLEGKEYYIVKKIVLNNCEYLYLSSVEDSNNFCIRKLINENGETILSGLDSETEFNEVSNALLESLNE